MAIIKSVIISLILICLNDFIFYEIKSINNFSGFYNFFKDSVLLKCGLKYFSVFEKKKLNSYQYINRTLIDFLFFLKSFIKELKKIYK